MTADDVHARASEAGARAITELLKVTRWRRLTPIAIAAAVVDAVEPIIRADATAATLDFCCADTRPRIEAEVRERIAQEIEADCMTQGHDQRGYKPFGLCSRCAHAARIARGGAQ